MSELIIDKITTRDGSMIGAVVVSDIDELLLLNTNKEINTTAIVKDSNRGGVFNYDATQSGVNNGGTIFNGWVRQYEGAVNVKWFGAKGDGVTDNTSIIQEVIDAGYSNINIPDGIFGVASTIYLASNINIFGKGTLKVTTAGAYNIFSTITAVSNVTISGITFDGSLNYPADRATTDKNAIVNLNYAIKVENTVDNFNVIGCKFNSFSDGSVHFVSLNSKNITIKDNICTLGSYRLKSLAVYSTFGYAESERHTGTVIIGNKVLGGGPTGHYDATVEAWCASSDGIHIDGGRDFLVDSNLVDSVASVGIRIEESITGNVVGNVVKNTGSDGIIAYKDCSSVVISNNSIDTWGTIPVAFAIRSFGGVNYIAKEFPHSVDAPLPADPSSSSWFEVFPYTLDGINVSTILPYSDTDYYSAGSGILPFRGNSAIGITQYSSGCKVGYNSINGDVTQDTGKYLYSCKYGVSNIHPVNGATDNTATFSSVKETRIDNTISTKIYFPKYQDPVNLNGTVPTTIILDEIDTTKKYRSNHSMSLGSFDVLAESTSMVNLHESSNGSTPPRIDFFKSRLDASKPIVAGGAIGQFRFKTVYDADGNNNRSVQISAEAKGTPSVTNTGASLYFSVTPENSTSMSTGLTLFHDGTLKPTNDNNQNLGDPARRWGTVYAGTGTINTSDDREKTYLNIEDVETAVALELKQNMRKFKFNDAISEKGDEARIHFGASAQTVKSIFEKHGLIAEKYAILCYDEWGYEDEILDDDGSVLHPAVEAGNRYGIRYEELLCFIISAL